MSLGDMFLRFDSREELDHIMSKSSEWLTIELEDKCIERHDKNGK